jgi:hypothetical protein
VSHEPSSTRLRVAAKNAQERTLPTVKTDDDR